MKNTLLFLSTILIILTSCAKDDTADIIINYNGTGVGNNNQGVIYLSGTYVEDLTLNTANTYVINGPMIMATGTTLTIPAGMTIEALAAGSDVYIAIAQGAKIIANGDANNPIVFTSNSNTPTAGDWGGLILLGKAPINSVSGGTATATSEIGSLPYGGNIIDDNSGSLSYVRVEYSGGKADGQSENNGFSFYGVGNGTNVDHIQMFEGLDDGVEFFGGTVNVSYLSVINAQDDSIDWTEGYSGTITNAYVKHGTNHDKGIEADGYNTDIGNNSTPIFWSSPTVTNITIIGTGSSTGNEAVRLRAGTRITLNNAVIEGFQKGFKMVGDLTTNPTGSGVVANETNVNNITFIDVTTKLTNNTLVSFTEIDLITGDGNGTGTDYPTWGSGWTVE